MRSNSPTLFLTTALMVLVLLIIIPVAQKEGNVLAQGTTFSCYNVTSIPLDECLALQFLYGDTGGPDWTEQEGWMENGDPCAWYGINCQMALQKVTHILLSNNNLQGYLPEKIGDLRLNWLDLSNNQITGPLPYTLWNTGVNQLMLANNGFTGSLPPDIGQLGDNITVLDISNNQLGGPLPAQLAQLQNLSILNISGNQFEGPLPTALTALSALALFDYSNTQLCEPQDSVFQAWLEAVPTVRRSGLICDETAVSETIYQIAYVDNGNIWLTREDGSHAQQLTESGQDCCLAWAPDGARLYFVRDPQALCVNIVWDNPSLQFSVECEGEEEKNNDTGTEAHHESKRSNG